jgi:hypothetical protein
MPTYSVTLTRHPYQLITQAATPTAAALDAVRAQLDPEPSAPVVVRDGVQRWMFIAACRKIVSVRSVGGDAPLFGEMEIDGNG